MFHLSPLILIYIITAIISIGIALVLIHVTRLSLSMQAKADREKKVTMALSSGRTDGLIQESVFKEVSELVGSKRLCKEISRRVVGVFGDELDKRIKQNSQEINRKYNSIIQEKSQNEEVAWKKYKNLLVDKKETEAVIHSIAEGLVVVDNEGKVVMMNPAAEKLVGTPGEDKIGQSLVENLKGNELISLIKGSSEKGDREIEVVSQEDETKKILRASSAVVEDEDGKTIGMVSVLSDITKQKELDDLKAKFVANVSHELRTPIVSIEKAIGLMLDGAAGQLSSKNEEFLVIAKNNIRRLTALINDLLDLAKLESGKMEPKFEVTSIETVIEESIKTLNAWADSKGINIEKKIQESLPEVRIDSYRIIQVLNNLMGNSIKFTPNGGNITVEGILRGGNEIEVSITDTGIGIAEQDLPKIFDKFYQTGERSSADIGGTGIGLSIAKEIVELHDGRIWAESEKNKGTRFIFTLPVYRQAGL